MFSSDWQSFWKIQAWNFLLNLVSLEKIRGLLKKEYFKWKGGYNTIRRNFCWEWQLWWEHKANCIDFVFCRPMKNTLVPCLSSTVGWDGGAFGCPGYFKESIVCVHQGNFWIFLTLQSIMEVVPLEGSWGHYDGLGALLNHPQGICVQIAKALVQALKHLKEGIKGGVSIWESVREVGLLNDIHL